MPVLTTDGFGLHSRRGWVFRDVNLSVSGGDLVALTGASGSGRTSLLLALTGHFVIPRRRWRANAGRRRGAGGGILRRATYGEGTMRLTGPAALGCVPGVYEPEPGLTVAEHVAERRLLLGRRAPSRSSAMQTVIADVWGITDTSSRQAGGDPSGISDPSDIGETLDIDQTLDLGEPAVISKPAHALARTLGRDLTAYQRHRLMLSLATFGEPSLIAVDDVDVALDAAERDALWEALAKLAAAGHAVIVTARELEPGCPAIEYPLGGSVDVLTGIRG